MKLIYILTALLASTLQLRAQAFEAVDFPPMGVTRIQKLDEADPAASRVIGLLRSHFVDPHVEVWFSGVYRLEQRTSLERLLPDWRFYRVNVTIGSRDKTIPYSTAIADYGVGLSPSDALVLPISSDRADFGTLLNLAKIDASTAEVRAAIQDAYHDLYGNKVTLVTSEAEAAKLKLLNASEICVLQVDESGRVTSFKRAAAQPTGN